MRNCVAQMFLLLPLLGLAGLLAMAEEPAANTDGLRDQLETIRKGLKVPGAVVGVHGPGSRAVELCLGLADVERQRPMTADCHFRIGSLSKVFVGTAVLILAGEGKLALDDPIAKYVPDVPGGEKITLRHLGSHRAGLFNHIESGLVKFNFAREPQRWWTLDELLRMSFRNKNYHEPGEKHHYSNAHTLLLAKVLEKVAGQPWADVVRERVIQPLGLKHTTIPTDHRLPEPFAEGYSLGTEKGAFFHRGNQLLKVTNTSPSWWGPAGCFISTLADLKVACPVLATGQLLTPAMRAELHRWTPADQTGYEYGFHLERTRGCLGHDGDVPGYQCIMLYHPEKQITVIALGNLYGWSVRSMPSNTLAQTALRWALGEPQQ